MFAARGANTAGESINTCKVFSNGLCKIALWSCRFVWIGRNQGPNGDAKRLEGASTGAIRRRMVATEIHLYYGAYHVIHKFIVSKNKISREKQNRNPDAHIAAVMHGNSNLKASSDANQKLT